MQKAILIFALSRSPWIGGIYYRKNIIHMLLSNKDIVGRYKIIILTNKEFSDVFNPFYPQADIISCENGVGVLSAILHGVRCCLRYRVRYVFPIMPYRFLRSFGITPVSWIADFQHCHYPDFFSKEECDTRDKRFKKIAAARNPLILSSYDSLGDFRRFFSKKRQNVHVVHFTSYIENELKQLSEIDENGILSGFGLSAMQYIAVCNQFWKHKDHQVVLEAVRYIAERYPGLDVKIVFTGELSDRRDPEYINRLKEIFNEPSIRKRVQVVGFVDRITQLCIMKHSRFIIQPSLFEGWGTVVEDAKVLNKRILLSDIKVHREQMDENCRLFKSGSSSDLAIAIIEMLEDPNRNGYQTEDQTGIYAGALGKIFI